MEPIIRDLPPTPAKVRTRGLVPQWLFCLHVALLVLTVTFWSVNLSREPSVANYAYSRDFLGIYVGAQIVASGHGAQLYNFEQQRQAMNAATSPYHRRTLMPFIYPAYVAVVLSPLGKLSLSSALLVWSVFNLIAAFWMVKLILENLAHSIPMRLAMAAWFFAWIPLQLTLFHGQLGLLAAIGITGAWAALRNGGQVQAGCWLALGLLKPQLIIFPLLAFLIWRCWRTIVSLVAALLVVLAISFSTLGLWIPKYINWLRETNRLGAEVAFYPVAMQNWRGLIFALLRTDTGVAARSLLMVLTLGSLIVTFIVCSKARPEFRPQGSLAQSRVFRWEICFAIAVLLGVLSSPHLYLHDWVVALPAIAILFSSATESSRSETPSRLRPIIWVSWLIALAPFVTFATQFGIWPWPSYVQIVPWYMALLAAISIVMLRSREPQDFAADPSPDPTLTNPQPDPC